MSASQTPAKVLILSRQAMIAALLGMLLELDAYEPVFARPGESPEDALTRVRPILVILLDGELDAAGSDLFFARAAKRGARVVLFAAPRGAASAAVDVEARALARGVAWFSLPIDRSGLSRVIALPRAMGTSAPSSRSTPVVERRKRPQAHTGSDGTLVYSDRTGQRWFVYDRRRTPPGPATPPAYRAFVNESGEEWRCALAVAELRDRTARALERQLARAVRVEGDAEG